MFDSFSSARGSGRALGPSWLGRRWLTVLAFAAALLSHGCGGCSGHKAAPKKTLKLDGQFAGCAEVSRGPVCAMAEQRRLRVWFPLEKTVRLSLEVDSIPIAPALVQAVEGGTRYEVELPAGASRLVAQATRGSSILQWRLRLKDISLPAWFAEAKKLRAAGQLDAASSRLGEGLKGRGLDRARALGLRARIALMRGGGPQARKAFHEAIRADRAAGLVSRQGDDACAFSFMLSQVAVAYGAAREVLEQSEDAFVAYPEGRPRQFYYRALIAGQIGDTRTALELLGEARLWAARLGMQRLVRDTLEARATYLLEAGRLDFALKALERVEKGDGEHTPPCRRANLDNNIGVTLLLSADRRINASDKRALLKGVIKRLKRASIRYRRSCPDAWSLANVLCDLAAAELALGNPELATERLKQSRQATQTPGELAAVWRKLDGQIALYRGQAQEAILAFEHASILANSIKQLHTAWAAEVGMATALQRLGRQGEAVKAARRAETILDDALYYVPLGGGRTAFLGNREKSARLLIGLLLKLKRNREALLAMRVSRTRLIQTARIAEQALMQGPAQRKEWEDAVGAYRRQRQALDAEAADDWTLAIDQLRAVRLDREKRQAAMRRSLERAMARASVHGKTVQRRFEPPAPNVLLLAYHPLKKGWVGVGVDTSTLKVTQFSGIRTSAPAKELAARLIAPFAAQLAKASRVRILPFGELRSLDFHALPWRGEPLLRHKVVEYPLDLGVRPKALQPDRKPLAVVVGNANHDLPESTGEAQKVAALLRGKPGLTVRTLIGSQATSKNVAAGISAASLFHFAGHAAAGAEEGWAGALRLAEQGRLLAGELLAFPRVPRWVVLSACEGARGYGRGGAEGLGLGQAFILAGAEVSVSTTRKVPDQLAARLAIRLYDAFESPKTFDLPAALRAAQMAEQEHSSERDWAAFRALTR